jgi:single-strand DNA-binding protein
MADLTVKGAIKLINPIKVISDKFQVREFVITTGDKYPQDIMFQTLNDRMDIIKPYGVGQEVEVSFNLRGRQVGDKFYNSLDAWKVVGEQVQDAFTILAEDDPF